MSDWFLGRMTRPASGRQRVLSVLAWAFLVLLVGEVLAQWREYRLTGRSILVRMVSQPDYVRDTERDMLRLRPNALIKGQLQEIRSNSLGLRSPELPASAPRGERRIAVVGASSVMGAYSKSNDDTLPAMLEVDLHQALPTVPLRVINAGIVGYGLDDQAKMLRFVSEMLGPEVVIVYPGVNDFASYCTGHEPTGPSRSYRLPQVELPKWLMSVDLLLKNTVRLRPSPRVSKRNVDARTLDLANYRRRVEALVTAARERGMHLVLSTNARSYRREQTPQEQEQYAATARYYNPCFDIEGLHVLYERHNAVIEAVGRHLGVPVLPVGQQLPGGSAYFHDAVHFTSRGKAFVAEQMARYLVGEFGATWRAEP